MTSKKRCSVTVDASTCEGAGLCEAVAAQLFQLDDDDIARPLLDDIPEELIGLAEEAAQMCPTRSITVHQG